MKKPVLPFFVTRTVKGREYCYYERGKERIRLPHYSEPHFHAAYADAISGKSPPKPKHTWSGLIDRYKRSDRFNGLKPRTREDYERYMAYIAQTIGDKDPARMTTPHIYDMLDANRHRVRFANYVVQVMSVLLAHAKRIGWVQHNAATGVEKLKSSSEPVNRPWTPETIEAFLGHADDRARLVFEMCYGTGQRIGDVLAMK